MVERNLRDEDAATTLTGISDGRVALCLLPFIPLMRGGAEGSIIEHWKQLAQREADPRKRADYGGLALVFAELTETRPGWKQALEGWNVEQSVQVLEWQAQAKAEGKAEDVLHVLRKRLSAALPADVEQTIRGTRDMDQLNRWFDAALSAPTLAAFRRLSGLKAPNGSSSRKNKSAGPRNRRKS